MMWKAALGVAIAVAAAGVHAQTKQELVSKVLQLQKPALEATARAVVERPAAQLMQAAGNALQMRVPLEKREAAAKSIETDVRKFVDDSVPVLQKRAVEIAPTTLGAEMQEKFNEDELKQLIAWLESPTNRKYQQVFPAMQNAYLQKLSGEASSLFEERLKALQQKVQGTIASAAGSSSGGAAAGSRPAAPASAPRK